MSLKFPVIAAAIASVCSALPVSAATLVYKQTYKDTSHTADNARINFSQLIPTFNASLGTLNHVTVSFDADIEFTGSGIVFEDATGDTGATFPRVESSGIILADAPGLFYNLDAVPVSVELSINGGVGPYKLVGGSRFQLSHVAPINSYISGPTTTYFVFWPDLRIRTDDLTVTTLGSLTTVLDYSPAAVPEPAAWAIMIGGFGVIGSLLRRDRYGRATVYS